MGLEGRFPQGMAESLAVTWVSRCVQPRCYLMVSESCVGLGWLEDLGAHLSLAVCHPTHLTSLLLFPWWGQHLPILPAHLTESQL